MAVGGLDSSAGAGLTRDLEAITALGARPCLLATAFTLQPPGGPVTVHARDPKEIGLELRAVLGTSDTDTAVKVGMVANLSIVEMLAEALRDFPGPVVFDPVLRTSGGGQLFFGDVQGLGALLARATIVTPNLDEARALTGQPVSTVAEAERAGQALVASGAQAVLVKGGHLSGKAVDTLITRQAARPFEAPRIEGPSPRGTGCALASAIAVGLAHGEPLSVAVGAAKSWLWKQIAHSHAPAPE